MPTENKTESNGTQRRDFLKLAALVAAASIWLTGCAEDPSQTQSSNESGLETPVKHETVTVSKKVPDWGLPTLNRYWEQMCKVAHKYPDFPDLEYFALALFTIESAGCPDRTSTDGAQGLGQMMPLTAVECAADLGYKDYNIFDPDTNIEFCMYYMFKRYNGNILHPKFAKVPNNPIVSTACDYYGACQDNYDRWGPDMFKKRYDRTSPGFESWLNAVKNMGGGLVRQAFNEQGASLGMDYDTWVKQQPLLVNNCSYTYSVTDNVIAAGGILENAAITPVPTVASTASPDGTTATVASAARPDAPNKPDKCDLLDDNNRKDTFPKEVIPKGKLFIYAGPDGRKIIVAAQWDDQTAYDYASIFGRPPYMLLCPPDIDQATIDSINFAGPIGATNPNYKEIAVDMQSIVTSVIPKGWTVFYGNSPDNIQTYVSDGTKLMSEALV